MRPDDTNPNRQYKYYEFVMAAFVAVYLCSNLIGRQGRPAQSSRLGPGHLWRRRAVLPRLLYFW